MDETDPFFMDDFEEQMIAEGRIVIQELAEERAAEQPTKGVSPRETN